MIRLLLALAITLLLGCNSTDSGSDASPLSRGTYQFKVIASDGEAIIQFVINDDGTYAGKTFLYMNDGSVNCAIGEGTGKWSISGNQFKMTERKARARDLCSDPFPEWLDRPSSSEEIRNITSTGFELYSKADDESPAEWVKFTKL
jgi:hypothetical protein